VKIAAISEHFRVHGEPLPSLARGAYVSKRRLEFGKAVDSRTESPGVACEFHFHTPTQAGLAIGTLPDLAGINTHLDAGFETALRDLCCSEGGALARAARDLHQAIWDLSPADRTPGVFLAWFDTDRGELRYVNTGCATAVLIREGGTRIVPLRRHAAGARNASRFVERRVTLKPGDLFAVLSLRLEDCAAQRVSNEWEFLAASMALTYRNSRPPEIARHLLEAVQPSTGETEARAIAVLRVRTTESRFTGQGIRFALAA
jgi:hypothetical protein